MLTKTDFLLAGIENPSSIVNANDEFIILDNPSLSPFPFYPYKNNWVIATFCEKGYARGRVNLREYLVEANNLMLILPGQNIVSCELSPDFEGKVMMMSRRFAEGIPIGAMLSLTKSVEQKPYYVLPQKAIGAYRNYIELCKSMIMMPGNFDVLEVLTLISKAFFIGVEDVFTRQERLQMASGSGTSELVESYLNLVEQEYRNHRDLDFYAGRLCKSVKYLSRVVAASTGHKATDWIERCIVLDAKAQLVSTKKRIAEISDELGFPSQSFFGKYFKRVTGLSPRAFREANR